jgi:hypothetical protein
LSHSSGGQKAKIELAGLVPSEGCEEESGLCFSSGKFLAVFGAPWLVKSPLQSLPSSSHGILFLVSVSVQISPFHKDASHFGPKAHPKDYFNLITSVRTLFPNKVTFSDIWVQYLF